MALHIPAAGALYVGGAAFAAGAAYLLSTPEAQRAAGSIGQAMGDAASEAVGDIEDLIFGSDDARTAPTTGTEASTETATGERTCPATPYWHYTDQAFQASILSQRAFTGTPWNYFLDSTWGPITIFYCVFNGEPAYTEKPKHWVSVMFDCTVPLAPDPGLDFGFMAGFRHAGRLNERPPHVLITGGGPNVFPEHPAFSEFPEP